MALWHKYSAVAYLAIILGVTGHASSEFFAVLSGISGPELSVWRFLLGGVGLVFLAILFPSSRNLIEPFKTDAAPIVLLSISGVTVGYLFFHLSLDYATVPQVATMVTTIPIFVGIINKIKNKEAFTIAKLVTGIGAVIGVALLVTDGYLAKLSGTVHSFIGIMMALACAATVAFYTVLIKPTIGKYGALRITAITMMIGGCGLWIVVGLFWNLWVNPLGLFDRSAGQLSSLLILALWNTTIAQFLWIGGMAAVPDITRGGYLFFLKPVIAAILAVMFLNQPITNWQLLAIFIICSSVLFEMVLSRIAQSEKGKYQKT